MFLKSVTKEERKLILLADVPDGTDHLKRILSPTFDLVMVHSLTAATRLIANVDFDGIVAGIHFDDSRMMDLLRMVRAEPRYADKSFVIVRVLPTTLNSEVESNAKQMTTVLGAADYITVEDVAGTHDTDQAIAQRVAAALARDFNRPVERR